MKKNGFTMIELIGVVTLLFAVALIAIPTVEKIMKEEAELFEGEEEAKVKRYIGKNVPTIVRRIIEVREV